MCLNRPKFSAREDKPTYIKVGNNTNKSKYEFLRLFYTKWNQITKPSPFSCYNFPRIPKRFQLVDQY